MSNEITIAGLEPTNIVPANKYANDEVFELVSKSGDYLPRIQLYGSETKLVKAGKFPMAHWGIVITKDNILDVGSEFDCAVFSWRPRAIRLSDGNVDNYYNPKHPEFIKIQERFQAGDRDSGCLYGAEFLLWVPKAQKFCGYHMNNKTAHRVAPILQGMLKKKGDAPAAAATIKSKFIETKQYSWHGPDITICSTPLAPLPTAEQVQKELARFNNPPESETETAEAGTETRER